MYDYTAVYIFGALLLFVIVGISAKPATITKIYCCICAVAVILAIVGLTYGIYLAAMDPAVRTIVCWPFVVIAGLFSSLFESLSSVSKSDVQLLACIVFVFVIVNSAANRVIREIKAGRK
jgi:RsiW-degrading membrane proteinase PrsW (M82 family)